MSYWLKFSFNTTECKWSSNHREKNKRNTFQVSSLLSGVQGCKEKPPRPRPTAPPPRPPPPPPPVVRKIREFLPLLLQNANSVHGIGRIRRSETQPLAPVQFNKAIQFDISDISRTRNQHYFGIWSGYQKYNWDLWSCLRNIYTLM